MKEILGSIAVAALLGVGCAHGQKQAAQAETAPPQATVQGTGQTQAGGMTASQRAPVLSCTAIHVGSSSSSERSQSLQEGPGTGGSAPVECVPSQEENTTVGQSRLGGEAEETPAPQNLDEGVGGSGNTEVKDDPAPMQPGQDSIGSSFQRDSAIIPLEERTQRDVAPADIVPENEGVGGAGNTDVDTQAAPVQSGQDTLGSPAQESAEPVAPELNTPEDSAPADTQFQDTGMGGAGGGGG
ncbi:hypothetical protein POL68_21040 [Stigmatella sp. ncwal1]|uniref:Lipoprotein n=1 Tax=Stigmatella ashevillensis TaxID=2995309 RepID=A0ABT5DF54_9BACT|nr:hypothetical protein [Stigmatella ashevillena]MDC0710971.1 hypothetical protein [Stigmatella ashevillena]